MLLPLFILFATACATTSDSLPEWKAYSRDQSSLKVEHLGLGKVMTCSKKMKDKGKLEGQEYSLVLNQGGPSYYRIGPTEPRSLRYFGVLQGVQFWGELPNFDISIRVGVKDLSHVSLLVYDGNQQISQSIEFSNCKVT